MASLRPGSSHRPWKSDALTTRPHYLFDLMLMKNYQGTVLWLALTTVEKESPDHPRDTNLKSYRIVHT